MSMVPDITAGTGTEFEEMLVCDGSGGLSQSEGAQERVLSVDGSLFRVPGHLGVGRPSIYTTGVSEDLSVDLPNVSDRRLRQSGQNSTL